MSRRLLCNIYGAQRTDQEEVDILQGRAGKSICIRPHYSPDVEQLRDKVLNEVNRMLS